QRVGAGLGVEDAEHLLRVDRDGYSFRRLSILACAVHDGRDPARSAEAPRLVLAPPVALLCVECRVHVSFLMAGLTRPALPDWRSVKPRPTPSIYTNSEETDVSS